MCASAREPRTWRSALHAQQQSACSGRKESRSRKSASIRGSEPLNASLPSGSTSTCGGPAPNLWRMSPQGRRRLAISVASYCCFFLIHSMHAVLPQNVPQQQPQQKYSAGAPDLLNQNNQRDHQRLPTLFSGASPLPLFKSAAAARVPVLPAAAGGEEAAQGPSAKNEVLPAPAEATFHFHDAASGHRSRAGSRGRHAVSSTLDMKSEKQLPAEDSRALWQQQRQGTWSGRGEERILQKEEGQEDGGPRLADTDPMARLQQRRGEENSHKKKEPSLERFIAPIRRKEYFLEKLKFWRKFSKHGDVKQELEHPAGVEESVQDKLGSTGSHSSLKTSATAVTSGADQPAADSGGQRPKSAAVVRNPLYLSGTARTWECRACAEGLLKAYRESDRTADCRGTGATPGRVEDRTDVAVFGIGPAQTKDVPDAAVINADSPSSAVHPDAAYMLRRRLAAVSEPSTVYVERSQANFPSHASVRGPAMHPELPLVMGRRTHAREATETSDTRGEDLDVDDLSADSTLADVSISRRVQRRRRGQSRGSALESRLKGTAALPGIGVASTAVETAELLQSLPQLNREAVARQQLPTTPNTRLPELTVLGTQRSDLSGRGGLSSSTGEDAVLGDSDDGRAISGSGAVRSSLGGPQGNRFSRLLGGIDTTKAGYSSTTIDSSTTSVPSPQRAGWSGPSSADAMRQMARPKASRPSNEFLEEEVLPARDRVSSVTNKRRFREHAQRLSVLNGVVEAAAAVRAGSASGTKDGRMPGASPHLNAPIQSVIDLGVTSDEAADSSRGNVGPLYQHGLPQWQRQLNEESQTQPLPATDALLEGNHLPPAVQEQLDGAEGARWPAEKPEEAVEETAEMQQLLRHKYIDKPLRKRQRVALVLEAILTTLSVWVLARITVSIMQTSTLTASVPFLMGKALAVMWLGRRIFSNLSFVGSAIQVLAQDIFLRRKRQQLLEVADALRTLQQEDTPTQPTQPTQPYT